MIDIQWLQYTCLYCYQQLINDPNETVDLQNKNGIGCLPDPFSRPCIKEKSGLIMQDQYYSIIKYGSTQQQGSTRKYVASVKMHLDKQLCNSICQKIGNKSTGTTLSMLKVYSRCLTCILKVKYTNFKFAYFTTDSSA